jgi:hypothetical protein
MRMERLKRKQERRAQWARNQYYRELLEGSTRLTVKLLGPGDNPTRRVRYGDCILRCIYYSVFGRKLEHPETWQERHRAYENVLKSENSIIRRLYMEYKKRHRSHSHGKKWEITFRDECVNSGSGGWLMMCSYLDLLHIKACIWYQGVRYTFNPNGTQTFNHLQHEEPGVKTYYLEPRRSEFWDLGWSRCHMYYVEPGELSENAFILQYARGSRRYFPWPEEGTTGVVMNYTVETKHCSRTANVERNMFDDIAKLCNLKIGMDGDLPRAVMNRTNMLRREHGQSALQRSLREDDLTFQAHDPGGYGQGKVIGNHTNYLRRLVNQEVLVSSDAQADVSMRNLLLHEEDVQMIFKTDTHEVRESVTIEEDHSESEEDDLETELPERVFLSRVVHKPTMSFPVMSDSGASNNVFGKGDFSGRILNNYLIIHDDPVRGWARQEDYHKKVEAKTRRTKHVIVANGDSSKGKSVDELHLGVEGRQWNYQENKWSQEKQTVFLRVQNATVCDKLTSSVFSEGNFLRNQPGWSIISQGEEKFMVYGALEIRYHPIGDQAPIRIDMKAEHGGHFLDVVTAVADLEQAKGRKEDVEWVKMEGVDQKHLHEGHIRCNMVRVDSVEETEKSNDCGDLISYDEEYNVRHVTTEDRNRVSCGKVYVMVEEELKQREYAQLEECMTALRDVTGNNRKSDAQITEAIERMEKKMDEIERYRRFLHAQKKDIVKCMGVSTRSSKKTEVESRDDKQEKQNDKKDEPEENIYAEYDKEYRSEQRERRRVRFEDFMKSAGRRQNISEHVARHDPGKTKEDKAAERKAKAIAEAERRGATKAKRADRLARDIAEQQHDLFKGEPTTTTKGNVQVYQEDKFSAEATIQDVSDYTLATYLMENKVGL